MTQNDSPPPLRSWNERVSSLTPQDRNRILTNLTPRLPDGGYIPHVPTPAQTVFLGLDCEEAFYGGAAGGGKSDALIMAALQYVDVPGYSALLLRRTFADLTLPGAIMDRTWEWLRDTDARPVQGGRVWRFPSGARITFGYVMYPKDVEQYRSAEFQYIGIDEVTQWGERVYEFLFSRLRRPNRGQAAMLGQASDGTTLADVPLRMRSASNPGGEGHQWAKKRFVNVATRRDGTIYVPARLTDNPHLDQDTYRRSLAHLGSVERARLEHGDWDSIEGDMFKRHWFPIVQRGSMPDIPYTDHPRRLRYWDLASTKLKKGEDPDWTAGALVSYRDGAWYLEDLIRDQLSPAGVEQLIQRTAAIDRGRTGLLDIAIEQEPGSAGVNTISHYRRNILPGYVLHKHRPTGTKEERARIASSAAENGLLKLVEGPWIGDFIDEAELFPAGAHDDQIDALSGSMLLISEGIPKEAPVAYADGVTRISPWSFGDD